VPPPFNAPILAVLVPTWCAQVVYHGLAYPAGEQPDNVASHRLARLATAHASRDDVLILSELRKAQTELLRDAFEAPSLAFERMSEAQRHVGGLGGLELLRGELDTVAKAVGRLARVVVLPRRQASDGAAAEPEASRGGEADGGGWRAPSPQAYEPELRREPEPRRTEARAAA
jgi:hypothetical protein